MLHETYATETNKAAVDTWQTVFVFGEGSVKRVDTPDDDDFYLSQAKKECQKAYKRAYDKNNKDRNKSYERAYYAADKDRAQARRAYQKAYRQANADRQKTYRTLTKDRRNALNKKWRAVNKQHVNAYKKNNKDCMKV
jgi:hypothetical protein